MQGLTLGIAALIAVQGIGLQQADGSSHSRGIIDNEESGVISIEKHRGLKYGRALSAVRLGMAALITSGVTPMQVSVNPRRPPSCQSQWIGERATLISPHLYCHWPVLGFRTCLDST